LSLSPAIHFYGAAVDGEVRWPGACEAYGVLARALRCQAGMGAQTPVVVAVSAGEADELVSPAEELFARLVHDLRNPLGIIAGFAETLAEAPAEERDDLCERLRINAERALHVLEELSLLADLRGGRIEPGGARRLRPRRGARRRCGRGGTWHPRAYRRAPPPYRGACRARISRVRCAPCSATCCTKTAPDDSVELSATATPAAIIIRIAATAPLAALDLELADAVASLYGGRCEIVRLATETMITIIVPAGTVGGAPAA
jgi:hypothetical protein